MNFSKILTAVSVMILIITVFVSCKKEDTDALTVPNEDNFTVYTTTEPLYTVGEAEKSEKLNENGDFYDIAYYDKEGRGVKLESYEDGELLYYYCISASDENGNGTQEKYYYPDGTLIGTVDNGCFFDSSEKQISEDVFEQMIDNLKN